MSKKILTTVPHKTNDQALNDLATLIYSVGGIDITTNLHKKDSKEYFAPAFGEYYSLESMPSNEIISSSESANLTENTTIKLNLNRTNPMYFARFGSLLERVRVGIENIILKFPAAIYSRKELIGKVGNNILNVAYFPFDNTSTFDLNVSYFVNPFQIYYQDSIYFTYSDTRTNKNRNLTNYYYNYVLDVDGVLYPILEFTPSKKTSSDYCRLKVQGKPFSIGNNSKEFYIRLNDENFNGAFNSLDDFESYLLNRETEYSAYFQDRKEVDGGLFINYLLKLQFPKSDKYNIAIGGANYEVYINDLIDFAAKWDETKGNIVSRKLIPDNVQNLTLESDDAIFPSAEKLSKLFIVYGRMWDDLYGEIQSIKFFNTVTTDREDNLPDNLLKNFASTLGWNFINDGLSADNWRQLIIHSAWLWKYKGTRSAIEFILKFFGVPIELVEFNEYVVQAESSIDYTQLEQYYSFIDSQYNLSKVNIDVNGLPTYPAQTDEDYFQMMGDYDGGWSYFNKWSNLLPEGFTGTQVTFIEERIQSNLIFEQDWDGTGNTLSLSSVGSDVLGSDCYDITGETISDPLPEIFLDECGCPLPISDKVLYYCVEPKPLYTGCTNVVLDVWYECESSTGATLYVKTYGGYPPYEISGATDGMPVLSGQTFNIVAIDSSGCTSNPVSIYIDCKDPCLGVNIDVLLDYECITDGFGQNTGQATIVLSASGGTEPYEFVGLASGDVVNHGQIAQVLVIDSNGCQAIKGIQIDCPPPTFEPCGDILLKASLETTNNEFLEKTAKVNAVYEIEMLPFGVYISGITLETIGVGLDNTYVVGSPVTTTFTTIIGADTISLDFDPNDIPNSITLQHTITILLTDGCIYQYTYQLSVNPRLLGNVDYLADQILSPIP